jgi:O-antigen/teichoic acid export membrane protein
VGAGLIAAAAGYAALPRVLGQYDAAALAAGRALLAFVVPGVASTVLIAALQLRGEFRAFNRLRYLQSALVLLALVGLAAADALEPELGALAYLAPTVPFFAWNAWWALRELKPRIAELGRGAGALLSFGVRVHGTDAIGTLLAHLDKLLLVGLLAPSVFGVYVVAFNLTRLITMLSSSVVSVLLPRTAGRPLAEALAVTSRALGVVTASMLVALGGFALLGAPVLSLLYGADFSTGYPVLVILAAEAAVGSAASILQQPYLVTNRAGTIALFQAASLGVAAVLIYVLALTLGAVGAAAGLLAASIVRIALTYLGFRALLGVAAPRLAPDWRGCALLVARLREPRP